MHAATPMWRNGRRNGLKIQKRAILCRRISSLFIRIYVGDSEFFTRVCRFTKGEQKRRRSRTKSRTIFDAGKFSTRLSHETAAFGGCCPALLVAAQLKNS